MPYAYGVSAETISPADAARHNVLLRLPVHLKDRLRELACENQRSLNGEATYAVARYIRACDQAQRERGETL